MLVHLIQCILALHSHTIHFLCTTWLYCRIHGLDLPTSLVIAGMRGANRGQPAEAKPPPVLLYDFPLVFFVHFIFSASAILFAVLYSGL